MRLPRLHSGAAEHHAADSAVGATHQLTSSAPRAEARSHHSAKFRTAVAGLIVLGAVALALAVGLTASRGRRASSTGDWSQWKPQDSGLAGAQEIADFVSPYYRATPTDQLAVVTTTNLNNPANPVEVVVPSTNSSNGLQALPPGSTVAYNLCGVGSTDCAIGVGQPSSARLLLLRREALELALYTFRYIGGAKTVVAVLPPGHTVQGCTGICPKPQTKATVKPLNLALAFDRKELQPWLNRPLRTTLPEALPPSVSQVSSAPESELVSVITTHGMFSQRVEHAQDGSTVIVLNPLPPQ
jgi:hypothetical protein